jgi:ketosteroid isomerase-like protein
MADSANVAVIREHVDYFTSGNIDAICNQCTDDVLWAPPVSRGIVPYNRVSQGRESVREYCRGLIGALEWQSFEVPAMLDAPPEHVVMMARESFIVKATGRKVDNVLLTLFRLRGGRIAEFTLCENTELVAWAFKPGRV